MSSRDMGAQRAGKDCSFAARPVARRRAADRHRGCLVRAGPFRQSDRELPGSDSQEGSSAALRSVEQLANLEVRYAISLLAAGAEPAVATVSETAGTASADPEQLMKEAAELVKWLLNLDETPECLSLLGGIYKRRALLASDKDRHSMLTEARDAYGCAYALALKMTGALDPYSALNWATCRFLLNDSNKSETVTRARQ
jgi:Tetratricopeptide Repeats-Sensor